MIGRIHGTIDGKREDSILLNIHGICFIIFLKSQSLKILDVGESISLEIFTSITDNGIKLYGFLDIEELCVFENLLKVSGINARIAISILDQVDIYTLSNIISNKDPETLINIKGIGKKIAIRIVSELFDNKDLIRIRSLYNEKGTKDVEINNKTTKSSDFRQQQIMDDAVSTLHALGYKKYEAQKLVKSAIQSSNIEYFDVGSLIKDSLNIDNNNT